MGSRGWSAAVAAVVVAAAAACSGGASTSAAPTRSPTPSATSTRPRAGLVGTIDRARLLAACEDLRGASTAADVGMAREEVDRFLTGAAALLEKPPTDADAAALGARIRADVAAAHESAAVDAGLAFCRQRG